MLISSQAYQRVTNILSPFFNLKSGTSNDLQTTQVTELSSCSIKAGVLCDALLRASSANAAIKTTGGCLSGIRRGFCRTRGFCISDDCLCGTDVVCATIKRRKLIWICSVEKGCTNYSSRVDLGLDWCPNTWQRLGVTGSDNKSWFLPTRVISAYYSSWQNQLGAHQQYGQANGSTKKENSTSQLSTS